MNINRRIFLKSSLTSAALLTLPDLRGFALPPSPAPTELFTLSNTLVQTWGDKLLSMQITDATRTTDYGGIYCPADKAVHGRCADAIYPFFFLAHKNNAHKYIDASLLLYQWMETHVSQDDGSWLNEPVKGSWKGTTVFTAIALAETIKHYGALMDPAFKARLMDRLRKAGEYVHANFTIEYGNINYPITATYGLSLLGEILDIQKFKDRGRELARQVLKFITPKDRLLHGEGDPYDKPSPKGCFSIDLGYAVEESLPSLVAYGLLAKDEEALGVVTQSLQAHLEFMLPDGGWDNSWGTRNYKWTYWGSRTTDGSQTAFTALADRDRSFYTAALANTRLLQQHTYDGLLYGGPHFHSHNIIPCVHHTFCHIKALTAVASRDSFQQVAAKPAPLPRQNTYGLRAFSDIQTWLVAKGKYRATITAYDREYKKTHNGHATGGALSMLWHEQAGVVLCASMNEYQLIEAGNMQPDTDPLSMPLTPRLEMKIDGVTYTNVCHLAATVTTETDKKQIRLETHSHLVDKDQNNPPAEEIHCTVVYTFSEDAVKIEFRHDSKAYINNIRTIIPMIASSAETLKHKSAEEVRIQKPKATVYLNASDPLEMLPTTSGRIFNYVPGLEAVPVALPGNTTVTISIV